MNIGIPVPQELYDKEAVLVKTNRHSRIIGENRALYEDYVISISNFLDQLVANHDYVVNKDGEHCTASFFRNFIGTIHYAKYFVDDNRNHVEIPEEQAQAILDFYKVYYTKYQLNKDFYRYLIDDTVNDALAPFIALDALTHTHNDFDDYEATIALIFQKAEEVIGNPNYPINHFENVITNRPNFDKTEFKRCSREFLSSTLSQIKIKDLMYAYDGLTYTDEELADAMYDFVLPYKKYLKSEVIPSFACNNAFFYKCNSVFFGRLGNALSKFLASDKYDTKTKIEIFFIMLCTRQYSVERNQDTQIPSGYFKSTIADPYYNNVLTMPQGSKEYISNLFIDVIAQDQNGYIICNAIVNFINSLDAHVGVYFNELFKQRAIETFEDLYNYKGVQGNDVLDTFVANIKLINNDTVKTYGIRMILKTSTHLVDKANEVLETIVDATDKEMARLLIEELSSIEFAN